MSIVQFQLVSEVGKMLIYLQILPSLDSVTASGHLPFKLRMAYICVFLSYLYGFRYQRSTSYSVQFITVNAQTNTFRNVLAGRAMKI
jgi:hypothetical protein